MQEEDAASKSGVAPAGGSPQLNRMGGGSGVRLMRVRCIGASGLKTGGWFLRLRSISRWLNTSTVHFSGSPVWDESFTIEVLRHMELELWEHDPVEGDKLTCKKTVNTVLDVFTESEPQMGVELVKNLAIVDESTLQLGFTLLPPGSPVSGSPIAPQRAPFTPKMSTQDNRRSIIGERRSQIKPRSDAVPELKKEDAIMEQLRQVNEALIAMGKPPLTKAEAALILEEKRREPLAIPKSLRDANATVTVQHRLSNGDQTDSGVQTTGTSRWTTSRGSSSSRRDSSTIIYSQFKQQIHLKDKEINEKTRQVNEKSMQIEKLEKDLHNLEQELSNQKALIATLEEKSAGYADQLRTKTMQFLLIFEKIKEEKAALQSINKRIEEELKEKEIEYKEAIKRVTSEYEEKVRLAREEGSLSTTIAYSIKLENERADHSRELARVKSDCAFEEEQLRKKAEFEKQALIQQYEDLLKRERNKWSEELRRQKEKSREKKQRLREERSQKEGVTQEMRKLEEKQLNDRRKWDEERQKAKDKITELESHLERETRENQRLIEHVSGLDERIISLEKKLQQAEQDKQAMLNDFAEQQETARKVSEVQLKRLREESSAAKERLEQEIENLKQKSQQILEREQSALDKERKEKLELKNAKVQLESERLELSERVKQLSSVEQELKALREKYQVLQKDVDNEKLEKKYLLTEKEDLQNQLQRAQDEAEAKAKMESHWSSPVPLPPTAPAPPLAKCESTESIQGEAEDVGGLLAAITRGVALQPTRIEEKKPPRRRENEDITEAIAMAIARRREMMMLSSPASLLSDTSTPVHSTEDDAPWDPDTGE